MSVLKLKIVTPLLLTLVVFSCATLNKNECKNANWQVIGYEDGSNGYPASRIGQHRKACAEYSITPELSLYNKGRAEGLHKYCVPLNAYNIGIRGRNYNGICAGYQEQQFISAFKYGKKVYLAKQQLDSLQVTLNTKKTDLKHVTDDIHHNEDKIAGNKVSATEAISLHESTEQLQQQQFNLNQEIHVLEDDIKAQTSYISELEQHKNF